MVHTALYPHSVIAVSSLRTLVLDPRHKWPRSTEDPFLALACNHPGNPGLGAGLPSVPAGQTLVTGQLLQDDQLTIP